MDVANSENQPALRRLALIDLGEREAAAIASIAERADFSVQLAVGERAGDPWLQALAGRGIAATTEIAELTRHVFDVAVVGEASPRRERMITLMRAMGTQVMPWNELLPPTPPELHVVAGGKSTVPPAPTPDDPAAVEEWLGRLADQTGASAARLVRAGSRRRVVAHVGDGDPMLETLSSLALQNGAPRMVSGVEGPEDGRLSGSWPITTSFFSGALAAAGLPSEAARAMWEIAARELVDSCARKAGRCEARGDWHPPAEFLARVRVAIAEGGEDRHSLHRLQFEGPLSAVETFCLGIHSRLRDTDVLCRPAPDQVLLLCSGTSTDFVHVRRRLNDLWEEVCRTAGLPPTLLLSDERIEMSSPAEASLLFAAASGWAGIDRRRNAGS
jgi:hypothetical protein